MEKYDIKKVVGEGSYGKAILCRRKVDSKMCIIKQISIKKLSRKEALLTEQEATLLKRLQHPNIVTFWESFFGNNNLHIVMEYADGGDLDHYIKAHAKSVPRKEIPEKQVINMFVQLSLAIKHIHDRKILHRDLKSQNVFLTSNGQLKLGDFGVSRVLRHTVELAATQIGTPYYMSPEIMDNQRYNSKTDIWSLGCILYELMCLRLPFDGSSMKQLCYNIIKVNPVSPSLNYSAELRELVRDTLHKNPKTRPGINSILSRPIMRSKISALLGETQRQAEFCHTVLHGANVLSGNAPQPPQGLPPPQNVAAAYRQAAPAPSVPVPTPSVAGQQRPSSAGAYAGGRPSSAGAAPPSAGGLRGPPVVASSAAQQAVAMLQAQRQQQIARQQQQLAQQQQYVGAMAAQMKAQIELTKQAEVARVRAQQQRQAQAQNQAIEDEQRRAKQQSEAKAREAQSRAAEAQRQAEKDRQRAADEQADRMRRAAALLDQQKALERRRQERMVEEARKIKEEERARLKEEERARQKAQAARAAARSPALDVGPSAGGAGGGKAAPNAMYIPAAPVLSRRPVMKPPIPANVPASQVAQAAPVRQFSAAALLARRRHSAPEKPPSPFNPPAQPSPAAPAASPVPAAVPMTAAALRARLAGKASPAQQQQQPSEGASNPFKAVVESRSDKSAPPPWMKQPAPVSQRNSPSPSQQQPLDLVVVGARASAAPSPSVQPPLASPSPVGREPSRAPVRDSSKLSVDGIASPRAAPFSPMPASPVPGPGFSPNDRRVAVDSAMSKVQDVLQAVQGLNLKGRHPEHSRDSSSDSSSSYGSIQPATPSSAVPASVAQKVSSNSAAPISRADSRSGDCAQNTEGDAPASSPWLSDLVGQMGQLKFQMKNLQQLRSPAPPSVASPHSLDESHEAEEEEGGEEEEDYNSSLSSITTANTPVQQYNSRGPIPVPSKQLPRNPPQQSSQPPSTGRANASQRTSYPLSADSSLKRSKALEQAEGFSVGLQPSASKESLAGRKESRARHNEDFRAFVQAQKQLKNPSSISTETTDNAAAAGGRAANPVVSKRPAFTPLSHHRAGGADDEDDGSEHGSLASVSSYSVPSSESSPDKQQPAQPSAGLHIKVPHAHSHAHNHKIKPAPAPAPAAVRANPIIKESASAGKLRAPVSAPSHSQPPRKGAASSAASVSSAASARSSASSAVSPRSSAGFNVEEFRSQRDAERKEMRQLMADRKRQLIANKRGDSQPATPQGPTAEVEAEVTADEARNGEIAVLMPSKPPPPSRAYVFTPSPQKEVDVSNQSLQYTMEVDVTFDHDHEQSRIFAHLETGVQLQTADPTFDDLDDLELDAEAEALEIEMEQSFAQQMLDERGDELGLTAGNDFEYSVLIEQMQQILRKPSVKGHAAALHAHKPQHPALSSIAEEGTQLPTPARSKLSPGRALAGELMMECDDDEPRKEELVNDQTEADVEVEDPDEFEEEDLILLEELDRQDGDEEGEGEGGDQHRGREVHENNSHSDAFADEDFDEEDDGGGEESDVDDSFDCLMEGDDAGLVDYSASHDPFLLPLMPALLTADMALLDPLRHAVAERGQAQQPAFATPEKGQHHPHTHHQHQHTHVHVHDSAAAAQGLTDEATSRRLQIAELQEYLVEKLGSAKVSEALHLLTVSTEATLLAPAAGGGAGSPERPDNYYDERDEELLNRIEDILGVDCLHYLDDMFMLLTLQ